MDKVPIWAKEPRDASTISHARQPGVVFRNTGSGDKSAAGNLTAEAVEGAALALERVDDVHRSDGLAAGVLGVGDRIANHVLKENLEHAARLLVDEARDALHATTACEAADRGLGDTLDVVAEHLAMTLGASLAKTLASLAASGHVDWFESMSVR